MLESAIAPHLRVERTREAKTPVNYEPPFPAYSARFPEKIKDLAVAYLGAQFKEPTNPNTALEPVLKFIKQTTDKHAPLHWDMAYVVDNKTYHNYTVIAYWNNKEDYSAWAESSGFETWWKSLEPEALSNGYFREVFFPSMDRFETVFSDNVVPEGAAHMREGVSGQIKEHVYWGSARDRLPIAQTDGIAGQKWRPLEANGKSANGDSLESTKSSRIKVEGKPNACIIRSGQDWSNTLPEERILYLDQMHPVLVRGMDFLRDKGEELGCYSCRFMSVINPEKPDEETDKTFGLAYFDDLDSLEKWSKEHETHLDIFVGFLNYAKKLNNQVSLRLFHEITVLRSEQQLIEYVGCHSKTGFLAAKST